MYLVNATNPEQNTITSEEDKLRYLVQRILDEVHFESHLNSDHNFEGIIDTIEFDLKIKAELKLEDLGINMELRAGCE